MNINEKKDAIQKTALLNHDRFGGYSTLAMCTGSGKSRCAILKAQEIVLNNPDAKMLLVCHTTDQRDQQWMKEFAEWDASEVYHNNIVDRVCYVSLHKIKDRVYDFVIMDEAHHLTEATIPFFENNELKSIIGLTATPPTDMLKKKILATVAPISFIYPLEQGVKDGVVAPFEIDIVYTNLESIKKTVKAGSKAKPFLQTEKNSYDYWDNQCLELQESLRTFVAEELWPLGWSENSNYYNSAKVEENKDKINKLLSKKKFLEMKVMTAISRRTTLIKNSFNKTRISKRLIEEFCRDDMRYLFFTGSIPQSNEILEGSTYNSESGDEAFNMFLEEKKNILVTVAKVNEGTNISNLDCGIVVQLNSKELGMIQRIGRIIRFRENHVGKIIILCVKDTRDEKWMESAIKSLSFVKINKFTENEFFAKIKQKELF